MKTAKLSYTAQNKISEKERYSFILANAPRYNMPHLVLCVASNDLPAPRLGLIIAKRKLPRAVDRNRLRRVIRENFRKQQHILQKVDIVVIAKTSVNGADFAQVGRNFGFSLEKAIAFCLRQANKKQVLCAE